MHTPVLMPPSIQHISKYLDKCSVLYANPSDVVAFFFHYSINPHTCLALISYLIKFRSKLSDHVIRRLDKLAAGAMRGPNIKDGKKIDEISRLFTKSFVPQVSKFFKVPKVDQLVMWDEVQVPLEKYEILAGFMDFLVQILNSESSSDPDKEQRYTIIQKELTFLLTFLGDLPFQRTDLQEVKGLLTEFETMANEAGSLIYSCIFAVPRMESSSFDTQKHALLEKVELLNAMIKEHCSKLPELIVRFETPTTDDAVDSLLIVDSLITDLEDVINGRFDLSIDDVKDHIQTVHEELTSSRALLKDFKLPHDTDMGEVKESLINIRDVSYEAEYLINLHVVGNVPLWYVSLRLSAIIRKIKVIGTRLQETKIIYDSKVLSVPKYYTREVSSSRARPTAGVDDLVIGFEDNRIKILDDLIGGSEELKIISIVGMPGLGKTTIANNLYNDQSISDHFDLRAWCVVSQTYQVRNVLIDILMCLWRKPGEDNISQMEDKDLGLKIYQNLKGCRYLIVIDDVWHLNTWDDLRRYFPNDLSGSRIMLTSRIKDTAPEYSTIHTLPLLSPVQCWDLLAKKVFHKEPCPPQLLDTGKCIAAKCNGLPLMVIVIAGILVILEKEENVWKKVERKLDTYMTMDESKCMKILELSYEHLPNHLKLCFLYLGLFPEDTIIQTQNLTWLWIAEGFIKKEEEQSTEDVAEKYLLDLINRSLIQIAGIRSDGGIKACSMHDLLRDMCLKRAHEEKFLKSIKDHSSIYEKHLRLSDYSTSPTSWRHFGLHCRSISGHFSDLSFCFPQMGLLRAMNILSTKDSLRYNHRLYHLVHLRYLVVDRMPGPEIAKLINLEVLCVENRFSRPDNAKIPSVFLKMVKLSHLRVNKGAEFEKDWDTSQTTNLKSLSDIRISNQRDEEILRCSPHLRKLKCKCSNGEVFPDLCSFTELKSLKIVFEFEQFKGEVAKVNFPSTIKKLTLCDIGLPWEEMSIVGKLPNLRVLKLLEDAFVGDDWEMRDGEFQELRFLKLDFFSLKRWITESEHFPKLERLVLSRCWEQVEIPSELGDIPTLQKIEVSDCSNEINESAARIEEERLENGNEEPKVFIQKKSR